jgi:integrase/recombinase XerD
MRLDALRAFFRWLSKANLVLANPASELELPRVPHRLPKYILTAAEVEQVMAQCKVSEPLGLRDRAMLETLYSTGIRRAELMRLEVFDLDLTRETVMIRQGKGQKDRVAPIGRRALDWVLKYMNEVRPQWAIEPDPGALFLGHLGQPLNVEYLTHLVRSYVEAAGLGKRGSCHLFRHTAATLMLENGADLRFIQAFLGHARLETTQIYTQVSIRQLKEIHAATHPAERPTPKHDAQDAAEVELSDSLAADAENGPDAIESPAASR